MQKVKGFHCFAWNSCKEYENVRQMHEEVKQNRDHAKEELKKLQQTKSPMTQQIQEVEKQWRNLDIKIKEKVCILDSRLKFLDIPYV